MISSKNSSDKIVIKEIFFGMYSDGKEGGSDGKEGCKDGGHCNRFDFSANLNDINQLDYQF
jgi:hypothetical protein